MIEFFFALALFMVAVPDIMVRACRVWMLMAIHPEVDLEAFLVLKQCVFVVTLPLVDCPDMIVRRGHLRRFAAEHLDPDLKAFLVLK